MIESSFTALFVRNPACSTRPHGLKLVSAATAAASSFATFVASATDSWVASLASLGDHSAASVASSGVEGSSSRLEDAHQAHQEASSLEASSLGLPSKGEEGSLRVGSQEVGTDRALRHHKGEAWSPDDHQAQQGRCHRILAEAC